MTRAIAWRQVRYVVACVGTMAVIVLIYIFVIAPALTPMVARLGFPVPVTIALALLPFFAAMLVVPGYVQFLATPRQEMAAFEAFSAFAVLDRSRWLSSTGAAPRGAFRNPEQGERWMAEHPSTDPIQKARILVWGGHYDEAAKLIDRLPDDDRVWRVHRAALTSLLQFVRDDDRAGAALAAADEDVENLSGSADEHYALLHVALERARLQHAIGLPWWEPFASARERISVLPKGASFRDRYVAGMRTTAMVLVLAAVAGAVLRF